MNVDYYTARMIALVFEKARIETLHHRYYKLRIGRGNGSRELIRVIHALANNHCWSVHINRKGGLETDHVS